MTGHGLQDLIETYTFKFANAPGVQSSTDTRGAHHHVVDLFVASVTIF